MAKVTRLIDDVTGKEISDEDGGTVSFSLQGAFYELDLSSETLAKLEKALKPYIDVAAESEPPTPTRRMRRTQVAGAGKEYLALVRTWARKNNYEVSDRGRIAANIQEAYEAAHKR